MPPILRVLFVGQPILVSVHGACNNGYGANCGMVFQSFNLNFSVMHGSPRIYGWLRVGSAALTLMTTTVQSGRSSRETRAWMTEKTIPHCASLSLQFRSFGLSVEDVRSYVMCWHRRERSVVKRSLSSVSAASRCVPVQIPSRFGALGTQPTSGV